jgi:predicted ATPase
MMASEKYVSPRFVNRQKELEVLKSLFEDTKQGHGIVVFVHGEAGIGKTRLISEFENHVISQGAKFLKGRGLYREESSPYLPFTDALNQFFIEREEREEDSTGIMGLVSERLHSPPMGLTVLEEKADRIDLNIERDKMFETIYELIRDISRENTLVLFLDDLQWADVATLRLMHYIARNIKDERVMLLGAYRSEELRTGRVEAALSEIIQRMAQEERYVSLEVKGLQRDSIGLMVKEILEIEDLPPTFIKKLFEESEGNPYFVEEVVKSLITEGVLKAFTKGEVNLLLDDMKIPSTIKDVMGRRIGRLDDDAKSIVMLASVIGSRFDFHVLHEASGMEELKLLDAIDSLIEAGLISEEPGTQHEIYRFNHSQVRAVIYDGLSKSRRRVLHNKIGEVVEKRRGDKPDEVVYSLARHFYIGKNHEKALRYLILSAEKATKQFALEETLSYCRTALEVLGHLEVNEKNKELALDLNMKLGKFLFSEGRLQDALNFFQHALKLSEEMGRVAKEARVYKDMGHVYKYLGDYERAEGLFEKSVTISTDEVAPQDIADIHRGLGYLHWRSGEFEDAIMHYNLCISNVEKIGDEHLMAITFIDLGNVYNTKGDLDKAIDYYKRSVELLEKVEDYVELPRALNNLGDLLLQKEEWDAAIENLEKAIESSEISGAKLARTWAYFNIAEALIHKGEFERAERALEKSHKLCIELNEKMALHGVYKTYGILHRVRKEWDKAIECFDKALELLKEFKVPYETGKRTFELALVYRDMGDAEKAKGLMKEAARIFEEVSAKTELEKVRKELDRMVT